jgi:hypothetical protein
MGVVTGGGGGGATFNGGTITNPLEIAPDASDNLNNGYLFLHSPFNEGSADGDPLVYADTHDGNRLLDVRDDGTFFYRSGDGACLVVFRNQAQTAGLTYGESTGLTLQSSGAAYFVVTPTGVGFYGIAPVAQQTGVAVTAAAIHAALVNLGLITA